MKKYEYEGMSLSAYCEKNNIKKFTIYSRIRKIKKENPNLTIEEVIKKALNKNYYFEEGNVLLWENTSLYTYCCNHPNLNYSNLKRWLNQELLKNPRKNVENLIKDYINGINNKNRWFYLKILLRKFCKKNNISYNSIRNYLTKALKNPIYANWTDNELVEYLVERRFRINGKVLKDYCTLINFSYDAMHEILKEELQKNPDTKFKIILLSTITTINQYRLTNYSKINNFNQEINKFLDDSTNTYLRSSYNLNKTLK